MAALDSFKKHVRAVVTWLYRQTVTRTYHAWQRRRARAEDEKMAASNKSLIKAKPYLYWGIIAGYTLTVGLVGFLWEELRWWMWVAYLLHLALSVQILEAHERGGVFVLGVPVWEAWIGPNLVLLGLMRLGKLPREPHQKHFPAEPDFIFHGEDKEPLPTIIRDGEMVSMVRPIRVVSGRPVPDYDSPLNIQITTKVNGTVRYYIEEFFTFWVQFPGVTAEEKFREADRQLEDTFAKTTKREWQQRPVGKVIEEDDKIHKTLVHELEKRTENWGIYIEDVNLYSPDLGHDLSKELTRIGEAEARKRQTITNADAARYDIEQKGIADANAKLARENADTDAAKYRAEQLNITGREIIALEAAHDILNPRDKFFFGANALGEAVGVGTAVMDAIRKMEGKAPEAGGGK